MVSSDHSRLLVLAIPALVWAAFFAWQWRSTSCSFTQTQSGLHVCKQHLLGWELQHALIRVQSREGLWPWRKPVDHWVLVDAGAADSLLFGSYASSLVKGIKRRLRPSRKGNPPGKLDLIIMTHAHECGALPKLLQEYPDAKVAAHEDELPFLVGSPPAQLFNGTQPMTFLKAADALGLIPISEQQRDVPPERALALHGEAGDLADAVRAAGGARKMALGWLPKHTLSFIKVGGHTPGSIAVIHHPSGALLVGDAVAPRWRWLRATRLRPSPYSHAGDPELRAAAKALLTRDGYGWKWLLPGHGGNFSREHALELVADWPDAAPVARDAHADGVEPEQPASSFDTAAAGMGISPGAVEGGHGSRQPGSGAPDGASRLEL